MMISVLGVMGFIVGFVIAEIWGLHWAVSFGLAACFFVWWQAIRIDNEDDRLRAENEGMRQALENAHDALQFAHEALDEAEARCKQLRADLAEARDAACESEEEDW